jgi:spermidine synthase
MTVHRSAAILGSTTLLLAGGEVLEARDVLHTERSLYQNIVVYEQDGVRCMTFYRRGVGGPRQTCVKLADPSELVFTYTKMMMAALYVSPAPARILVIGLGGGTLPMVFEKLLPGVRIDAVEIDRAVISVADRFFGLRAHDRLQIHESDGRVFVKRSIGRRTYDLIVLDAFNHDYIPEHLLTREFLGEVRQLMKPGSVLAANTFTSSALYDHESVTYATVFGTFYNLRAGSRVIIARLGGVLSREDLLRNADRYEAALQPLGVGKNWLVPLMSTEVDWRRDVRPLTDQYSPSNLLNR